MTVERSEFEQIHNDGIEHICHALMSSGLWQEIDGDGTEYTVIADRIVELILYLGDRRGRLQRRARSGLPNSP